MILNKIKDIVIVSRIYVSNTATILSLIEMQQNVTIKDKDQIGRLLRLRLQSGVANISRHIF